MKTINEIYKRHINGQSLTDAEVLGLKEHMETVANHCILLGERFYFAFYEANRVFLWADSVLRARNYFKKVTQPKLG